MYILFFYTKRLFHGIQLRATSVQPPPSSSCSYGQMSSSAVCWAVVQVLVEATAKLQELRCMMLGAWVPSKHRLNYGQTSNAAGCWVVGCPSSSVELPPWQLPNRPGFPQPPPPPRPVNFKYYFPRTPPAPSRRVDPKPPAPPLNPCVFIDPAPRWSHRTPSL